MGVKGPTDLKREQPPPRPEASMDMTWVNMGGCQKLRSLFGGNLNMRCRIVIGIQKGTIILTTAHMICNEMQHNTILWGMGSVAWHESMSFMRAYIPKSSVVSRSLVRFSHSAM